MSELAPPPEDVTNESTLRGWLAELPPTLNVVVACEVAWLHSGGRAMPEEWDWVRGRRTLAELAERGSVFGLTSRGRRRTARRRTSTLTCIAHAERGSWVGAATDCAILVHESRVSYWRVGELLTNFHTTLTDDVLAFAATVEHATDRMVLWDLLLEQGWRPTDDELAERLDL